MSVLSGDYAGCAVYLYNAAGNALADTTVIEHHKDAMSIELADISALQSGESLTVMILTAPVPCVYQGRVSRRGSRLVVGLHHGQEKEDRTAVRYPVDAPAVIENLISEGRLCPLHTPVDVRLVNISKTGARVRSPAYALTVGDAFQMRMKIGENYQVLAAEVIHDKELVPGTMDYGCRFLAATHTREG